MYLDDGITAVTELAGVDRYNVLSPTLTVMPLLVHITCSCSFLRTIITVLLINFKCPQIFNPQEYGLSLII